MPKTKTINLRIDEEVLAKIDALAAKASQSRTMYMVERSLATVATVITLPAAIADKVTTASQLPTPSKDGDHPGPATGKCPRCDSKLIPWSTGWERCKACGMNWPAGL